MCWTVLENYWMVFWMLFQNNDNQWQPPLSLQLSQTKVYWMLLPQHWGHRSPWFWHTHNLAITVNVVICWYLLLSKSFQESLSLAEKILNRIGIVPRISQPKQDIAHCQHRLDGPWSTTDWLSMATNISYISYHFTKVYLWRKQGARVNRMCDSFGYEASFDSSGTYLVESSSPMSTIERSAISAWKRFRAGFSKHSCLGQDRYITCKDSLGTHQADSE